LTPRALTSGRFDTASRLGSADRVQGAASAGPGPAREVRLIDYECLLLERPEERLQAAGVAVRALRDNPVSMEMSADPLVRLHFPYGLFCQQMTDAASLTVGARVEGYVLGVAGATPPGSCIAAMLPPELRSMDPPGKEAPDGDRFVYGGIVMADNDLPEPHWHVGPVAVEPGLQGLGVGTRIMRALCDELDGKGEIGWLETDKAENVRFYTGFGFEVAGEAPIFGARFWFMRRDPC
jgi:ribosomal protein S18 acetylase RimI-like enzyme